MKLSFSRAAWDDYLYWQKSEAAMLARVNELIRDRQRSPFSGLGKPEPLRGDLKGWWSRRITGRHRLVYRVGGSGQDATLDILACRFHYRR